jgi:hypothetical protein
MPGVNFVEEGNTRVDQDFGSTAMKTIFAAEA